MSSRENGDRGAPRPTSRESRPRRVASTTNAAPSPSKVASESREGTVVDIMIPTSEALKRARVMKPTPATAPGRTGDPRGALAWNAWGPEVINGRCAMLGWTFGAIGQSLSGDGMLTLAHDHVAAMGAVIATVVAASFAPEAFGRAYGGDPTTKDDDETFTASKEMLHGRIAMLAILFEVIWEMNRGRM